MSPESHSMLEEICMQIGNITKAQDVVIIVNEPGDIATFVSASKDNSLPLPEARKRMMKMIRGVANSIENGGGNPEGRDGQTVEFPGNTQTGPN